MRKQINIIHKNMKKNRIFLVYSVRAVRRLMPVVICILMIFGIFPALRGSRLYTAYYPVDAAVPTFREPGESGGNRTGFTAAEIVSLNVEVVLNPSDAEQQAELLMQNMTVKQKAGQMFFCAFRYNQNGGGITEINSVIEKTIKDCGIGGVILFSENIKSAEQVTDYIHSLQQASDIPLFIGIDEEGGRVVRTRSLDVPRIQSALSIGSTGDPQSAYNAAKTIAGYLAPLGVNVDFAPVADVFTNPSNTVIGDRAFSRNANQAGEMVAGFVKGSLDNNILPAVKHFPGHGDTKEDSHYGMASTAKTLAELSECEFIPFQAGIDAGAPFVMTSHITAPNIVKDNTPAVFSEFLLQDILRNTLGFNGIIITDSLEMGAIAKYYTSEETAVKAVLAGVDMLLMPDNFSEAYSGIINAVKSGTITEKRIDESVKRILTAKYKAGIITPPALPNKNAELKTYNIGGNNYVKLRDIAYILNGTAKQFEIGFDEAKKAVLLTSGKPYTEPAGQIYTGGAENAYAAPSNMKIFLDGREINLTAYSVNGNNYVKLRDIGKIFDFNVEVMTTGGAKNTAEIRIYEKYENYTGE